MLKRLRHPLLIRGKPQAFWLLFPTIKKTIIYIPRHTINNQLISNKWHNKFYPPPANTLPINKYKPTHKYYPLQISLS